MSGTHCFTSVSFSYLSRARVLAETVRRHHPDWTLWICISDRAPDGLDVERSTADFDRVIWVEDLPVENPLGWIFGHDVVELCTAVKGFVMSRILDEGAERIVYLDPDIALFGPLAEVEGRLSDEAVLLTPHMLDPEDTPAAIADNEISCLLHGVYNLGFVAVANVPEGRRFARWWRDRLAEYCIADTANGLFTDQRWCDLAPALFDGVGILRDPGYNVASWNLSRRPITIERTGEILAKGRPLRFYHFTKVDTVGEQMIERYAGGELAPFELLAWYRRRLAALQDEAIPAGYWHFGSYENGVRIPLAHRRAYRARSDLAQRFPNPFAAGPESFRDHLGNGAGQPKRAAPSQLARFPSWQSGLSALAAAVRPGRR